MRDNIYIKILNLKSIRWYLRNGVANTNDNKQLNNVELETYLGDLAYKRNYDNYDNYDFSSNTPILIDDYSIFNIDYLKKDSYITLPKPSNILGSFYAILCAYHGNHRRSI